MSLHIPFRVFAFSAVSLVACNKSSSHEQSPPPSASTVLMPPDASRSQARAPVGTQQAEVHPTTAEPPPEGMVSIAGGTFDMGLPPEHTGGNPRVRTIVKTFYLDRLEVSTAAYMACVNAGRCEPAVKKRGCNAAAKRPRLNHPINCITKVQAEHYCAQQGKRLPSEAEWEFAARGTDGRTYPWGNDLPKDQLCWERRTNGAAETCPVGSFPQAASPFGALDMAGNVWEWTSTQETETAVRPAPGEGLFRIRGGSFKVDELSGPDDYEVRSDQRSVYPYDGSSTEIGVRCAQDGTLQAQRDG